MFVTQGQLLEAIAEYIDTDIMAHTNKMTSVEQFIFGFKVGAFKRSLPNRLNKYVESAEFKLLGAMADDGRLDVDALYEPALESMRKVKALTYGGLKFNEDDVKKLYELVKQRSSD